jgi:hypothetical protein
MAILKEIPDPQTYLVLDNGCVINYFPVVHKMKRKKNIIKLAANVQSCTVCKPIYSLYSLILRIILDKY